MFAIRRGIRRHLRAAALGLSSLVAVNPDLVAADNAWTNASGNFIWDTTSANWSQPPLWNNANGDGAIFGTVGVGTITVPGGISVNSFYVANNGYTFNGTGPFTLVNGTSTQTTGVFNVDSGITTTMNVPIMSTATAFQKIGAGVLELSQPMNISASFPLTLNGNLSANVLIGPVPFGNSPPGGILRVLNSSVLTSATTVALGGASVLDIGANNVTVGGLIFTNQNQTIDYANYGVQGTGTLRVTGEINVIGQTGGNFGNAIKTPLDLGGGTQIVRSQAVTFFAGPANLMFAAPISNGSLLKTAGVRESGIISNGDGIALLANNTYAGSTVINTGTLGNSMASGTNASTSLKLVNAVMSLQGADGSFGSAPTIEIFSGSSLVLDNNASFGGNAGIPAVPAANNNNRIMDTAAITLRDSGVTYRGLTAAASSETYGSLNVTGGHNVVTIAPTGAGGTATFQATGNLTLDPRATLQIAGTTLSAAGQVKFGGTVPAAVGGIIPRMISSGDFVFYDATNGFTPLPAASYQNSFVAGANVSLAAASATNTIAINALKTTASLTTTINAGQTLTVDTGMMLSASGTHTLTGGTLNFGASPGVFFGSHTVNSAMTGSQGLLHATGTLTLAGDMSGLTGTVSNIGTGTMALNTNSFAGPIEVRRGTLNIGTATLSGTAPITLGVAANDVDLLPTTGPTLSTSAAGVGAVISRPIVVDNGATNAAGLPLDRSGLLPTLQPLSNTTGSQTINSDITLNTSLNFQGGGGGGTGATTFGGDITGDGIFVLSNGRANFTGSLSNAGGMIIAQGGFTGIANFQGTVSGAYPITLNAGSNSTTGMSYSTQSNIGTGPITVQNSASVNNAPTITTAATSSISNNIVLNGHVKANVGDGITGTWAGPVTGTGGNLEKIGNGTLVLSNAGNTYNGDTNVTAGVLALLGSGSFANSKTVTVGTMMGPVLDVSGVTGGANFDGSLIPGGSFALAVDQRLRGSGTVSGETAARVNSFLAPGNSIGTLTFDSDVAIAGTLEIEATSPSSVDLLNLTNMADLMLTGTSVLAFAAGNTYDGVTPLTLVQLSGGTVSGTFGAVTNLPSGYFIQYNANSIQLMPVPEPASLVLGGLTAGVGGWVIRRRRRNNLLANGPDRA